MEVETRPIYWQTMGIIIGPISQRYCTKQDWNKQGIYYSYSKQVTRRETLGPINKRNKCSTKVSHSIAQQASLILICRSNKLSLLYSYRSTKVSLSHWSAHILCSALRASLLFYRSYQTKSRWFVLRSRSLQSLTLGRSFRTKVLHSLVKMSYAHRKW